jgi:hypothetical protein
MFIQNAMPIRYIIICGLPGSTIFFHIILQKKKIRKKVTEN